MTQVCSSLTGRENGEGHSMDAVLQEERYRYMLEKSLCSLVCETVQDDPEESWSSYWKKFLWLHNVTRDLWPHKTMWSYSCNCHPCGSVLIRAGVAQSRSRVTTIGSEARGNSVLS